MAEQRPKQPIIPRGRVTFRGKPLDLKHGCTSKEAAFALARVIRMTEKRNGQARDQMVDIGCKLKAKLRKCPI
jgi:hypothetical protein